MQRALLLTIAVTLITYSGFAQGNRRTAPLKPTKGRVELTISPLWSPKSLKDLEGRAELVIDGSVQSVVATRLTDPNNPASLETDYLLKVNRILGGSQGGSPETIVVSQLGGKSGDLEVVTPQNPAMKIGENYILFLNRDSRLSRSGSAAPGYEIAGVWSGKLRIENGRVQIKAPATNSLREHDNEPVEQFVRLVKQHFASSTP